MSTDFKKRFSPGNRPALRSRAVQPRNPDSETCRQIREIARQSPEDQFVLAHLRGCEACRKAVAH